jgi:hypothetical protein
MSFQIATAGSTQTSAWQGSFTNSLALNAYTTEGAEVNVVAPLSVEMLIGVGIQWDALVGHIELHGDFHFFTACKDGWYQQTTNFTATSIGSHTQTVRGDTQWQNEGNFNLMATAAQAVISIAAANDGTVSLAVGNSNVNLRDTGVAINGGTASVTGSTTAQVSGGGNSALLNADQASLLCGTAGIKATAASTVISGTKVEIGLPNGPNQPVATMPAVEAYAAPLNETTAAITQLRSRLQQLQEKIARSRMLSALLR